MSAFQDAKREYDEEVDVEAAKLVRIGIPPFRAISQAQEIVRDRRLREAVKSRRAEDLERSWT